ncbi:MAG: thiamine pyrophosphate-dependent dehydrogenase E1 component subunit alpha [Proteobacteria bacterium]|nr:thiamine pyrophosphate-dependent dehydrogenase E1 component subunit alpha [Pseudomonadota bacterium]
MSQTLDSQLRLKLYQEMLRIRIVENAIAEYYGEQEMRCPVHLSIGQEAAEAGACAALEKRDYVLSGHRSHGHYLAKGGDLKAMMAEIYGKATGCAGGKGGSMHLVDLDAGFLGAAPIVGSTIPIAAGVAFAGQMRNEDRVVMVFLGDGATETGVFYETVNFAALKNLPIVFLVENNFYSVYSPMDVRQKGEARIVDIARAHGMEAHQADGNDLDNVYQLCSQAVTKARGGGGPSLLEFTTYRWREHCGPGYDNDIGYRTEAEFLSWKERDPVAAYERKIITNGVATQKQMDQIAGDLQQEVEAAIAYAKQSPWPDLDTLSSQVYAN